MNYWPQAMAFLDTGAGYAVTTALGVLILALAVFRAARRPAAGWRQTAAITENNPTGSWEPADRQHPEDPKS